MKNEEKIFLNVLFLLCFFAGACCGAHLKSNRVPDYDAGEYRAQYEANAARLDYIKSRVDNCTEQLERDEQSIHGVIEALRVIAKNVREMESCLYDSDRNIERTNDLYDTEQLITSLYEQERNTNGTK